MQIVKCVLIKNIVKHVNQAILKAMVNVLVVQSHIVQIVNLLIYVSHVNQVMSMMNQKIIAILAQIDILHIMDHVIHVML